MEPKAKKVSWTIDDGILVLDKLKGRIVLRIKRFSKFIRKRLGRRSKPVRIRGFDWALCATPIGLDNKGIKFYIKCDGDSRGPDWKCVASVILFCTTGGEEFEMGRKDDVKFDATSKCRLICMVSV